MAKCLSVGATVLLVFALTYGVNAEEKKGSCAKSAACAAEGGGCAAAAEKKCSAKCPISGKAVSTSIAVAYKGGKVFLCCAGCTGAFKKNTDKYAAKANHQLVATGQAKQAKCPLTGGKCNPDTATDVAGVKVCFCCGGCKGKAAKAKGDEQIKLVFGDKAFAKGFKVAKAEKKK
jgi:YHS domain-containing protein